MVRQVLACSRGALEVSDGGYRMFPGCPCDVLGVSQMFSRVLGECLAVVGRDRGVLPRLSDNSEGASCNLFWMFLVCEVNVLKMLAGFLGMLSNALSVLSTVLGMCSNCPLEILGLVSTCSGMFLNISERTRDGLGMLSCLLGTFSRGLGK